MLKPLAMMLTAAILAGIPTLSADAAAPKPAAAKKQTAKKGATPAPQAVKKPAQKATAPVAARVAPESLSAAAGLKVRMDMAASVRVSAMSAGAGADAVVYTNRQGAITGLTIKASGLPDPQRLDGRSASYVVWLVGKDGQRVRRLGELESRNGARADFGFTAEAPMEGFDHLMITNEPMHAMKHPTGAQRLSADLTMARKAGR